MVTALLERSKLFFPVLFKNKDAINVFEATSGFSMPTGFDTRQDTYCMHFCVRQQLGCATDGNSSWSGMDWRACSNWSDVTVSTDESLVAMTVNRPMEVCV